MQKIRQRQERGQIVIDGWGLVGMAIVGSATLALLGATFWFADWRATVNHRFNNLESRMTGMEVRMASMETRMTGMESEMRLMREILDQRLPEKTAQIARTDNDG